MSTTALQKKLNSLWTVQQLCQKTKPSVTPMTIHLWRANRGLPAVVIAGDKRPAIRFVPADIRRWAKRNQVELAA